MFMYQAPRLTNKQFNFFSELIYTICGIKLPPIKKAMLIARISKRLRALQIPSFAEYIDFISSPEGEAQELVHLIDTVSTNKTDFFREADHFNFITQRYLPELAGRCRTEGGRRELRIWSAGCSSGEEPYTMAMVLADFAAANPWFSYAILATDISTKMLAMASQAVYADSRITTIPETYRRRYLMRGKGAHEGTHRIVPELRQRITFRRLNFLDSEFDLRKQMDIIFCRNVIIYFDQKTQMALFQKFYRNLAPGGYLFIGHSEALVGLDDRMTRVAASVFTSRK
ncbi:MAG: chemotaxis protein CheR [Deltaproteobacteria bacterium RIFOXYD12_FULL_50_9]|nr:MAG: chemotaxis protein CheR [Deltaproteobacteria bacterium RIFOXYD12_FULL_50_9]